MIVSTNADGSGAARRRVPASAVRVVVEGVWPELDAGRFPIKRVVGENVWIEADVFADGHEMVAAALRFRSSSDREWREVRMTDAGNDRWRGCFDVSEIAEHSYTVVGWIDRFETWRRDLRKKVDARVDVSTDLLVGAALVAAAAKRATGQDRDVLRAAARAIGGKDRAEASATAFLETVHELMGRHPDRRNRGAFERELRVNVERPKARFSSWYELFPRSTSPEPGRHGTFDDVIARLPYVQELGFDVLYLPPIHPIAHERRKGKNNAPTSKPGDPGSPWAIGAVEGGHTAVHPDLGTLEDFARLIAAAAERDIEVALDIAFQCTPEHPWVREHPEWFKHRPDGSIQHAENPPKVYQDIYPLDFETKDPKDRRALWEALRDVFLFWCEHGVRMFRVDNPHTKPFPFWEWTIAEVRAEYPDAIFLAEAFTRPKVMYRLAKLGFTQSYTYFTWKNTKQDLTDYLTELTRTGAVEFFRPNFWPNTPDILHDYLQTGGRPAFAVRLVLAATLASNYGIYGPAFELMEHAPIQPGSEEYLNSEKYEIRHWDLERAESLAPLVAKVNRIRRENAALQDMRSLRFHGIGNDQMIAYSKRTEDRSNVIVVIANLDPKHARSGWTELALDELGFGPAEAYEVEDLLTGAVYTWRGASNFVQLDPAAGEPAHVFRVGPRRSGTAAAATRARQAVPV